MNFNSKILVLGHRGMVGSAILRELHSKKYFNYCVSNIDLRKQELVNSLFESEMPEYLFLCAARAGGIKANNERKAEFIYDNLMIQANVIHAAKEYETKKLLFLGSSCIYPKSCPQPIKEEYLLKGSLEATNEPYAIAKIAGLKMIQAYRHQYGCNFISCMPTNLYGTGDNFKNDNAHVIPALIRRVSEAKEKGLKEVEIWGTGKPQREFLHVDDLAEACITLMKRYNDSEPINIGSGEEVTIADLAELICHEIGYRGNIVFNHSKPDGTMRKVLSSEKIRSMGWEPKIKLKEGIKQIVKQLANEKNN